MTPNPPSPRGGTASAEPSPNTIVAVILAAGHGTRMRSRRPKVLHDLCGRPMLAYVLDAAHEALGVRPLVVISPRTEEVRTVFAEQADFCVQPEMRGTGDALGVAVESLPPDVAEVVVLNGDVPLIGAGDIKLLVAARREARAAIAFLSVDAFAPSGLGRVVRDDDGRVRGIVEEKDATDDELEISEVNSGIYAFDGRWLRAAITGLRPSAATGELYLTHLVEIARGDRRPIEAIELQDDGRLTGVNDREQLSFAETSLRERVRRRLMDAGATLVDPSTAYVDAQVELGQDVVVQPNVFLHGRTRVGADSVIGAGSQIFDSVIGERCRVWASVVESSVLEDDVQVGPFSHVRPGSLIGKGARLGNYAEVKNSRLGPGVQQHHFSYLGDAEVGARTNVGAGTITANYDGARKLPTTIGEGAFLGVDTMLVAPVEVGDGAKTGAGAVVTRDVPAGKLAVGVPARIREPRPRAEER